MGKENHNQEPAVTKAISDQHERESVRWGALSFILLITCIGVLVPKLLMMIEGYENTVRSWSYDAQYLIQPTVHMSLVIIAYLIIQRMNSKDDRFTMGLVIGWVQVLKGLGLGFACTTPMLVLGLLSEPSSFNRYDIMYGSFGAGLGEEIFYRAFLFGALVQVAKCPLWPAAILNGVIFGLAHIDITPAEGQTILGQLNMWNAIIGAGGLMYAWLYIRSPWNLWFVIAMHIGMNIWWEMFALDTSPLGGLGATLVRILSVGLGVYFVIFVGLLNPKKDELNQSETMIET